MSTSLWHLQENPFKQDLPSTVFSQNQVALTQHLEKKQNKKKKRGQTVAAFLKCNCSFDFTLSK